MRMVECEVGSEYNLLPLSPGYIVGRWRGGALGFYELVIL